MISEAPPFWYEKPGLIAWGLSPAGAIYGHIAAKRMQAQAKSVANIPVFCIGNFIAGGAGKTPTAMAVAKIAKSVGMKPGFLSRGYGGSVSRPTLVNGDIQNARDVGDEALILCTVAPTVVSPDRPAGAELLEEQGVDIIIMDDGFQNPSLHKDYVLAVVDSSRGIGNGFCIPAGPMRAELQTQMKSASAVLLVGTSAAGTDVVRKAARMAKPTLSASISVHHAAAWKGIKVLAFAGIADPSKFHRTLEDIGAEIVEHRNFDDHHEFSPDECRELIELARSEGLTLVTTQKDQARMMRMGEEQEKLLRASKMLRINLNFENPRMVEMMLGDAVENAAQNKLVLAEKVG